MKNFVFPLIILSALLGTTLYASAQDIKLTTLTKPGSPQRIVAAKFKELIETGSAGKFTVTIDPAGVGSKKEIEAIEWIQNNTIQMGIIAAGAFEDLDPIARVISFPFLFKNERQAAAILDGPLGATILRDLETIGCKGLAFSETGFRNLTNNIRPVKTLADLSGLKIRIPSSSLYAATWLALGANPTPKSWPIYSELEQGILDGQESPLWIIETYNFFEVQKYLTLTRHSYRAHIGVASLQWWNTLSREDQNMIQEAMKQAALYQRMDQRTKETARLTLFKNKGMIIEEQPDIETFRSRTARLKEMSMYREPRVQVLLAKMQKAALLPSEPAVTVPEPSPEAQKRTDVPEQTTKVPLTDLMPSATNDLLHAPPQTNASKQDGTHQQPEVPASDLITIQPNEKGQALQEVAQPTGTEHQSTALELLDAPNQPEKPAQIIHQGRVTSDGETPPPIIEERIPAQDIVEKQPASSEQTTGLPPAQPAVPPIKEPRPADATPSQVDQ